MKNIRFAPLLFSMLFSSNILAGSVTLNFQALEHADGLETQHGLTYSEQGFAVSADDDGRSNFGIRTNGTLSGDSYLGSTSLTYRGALGGEYTIAKEDGGAFDFLGLKAGTTLTFHSDAESTGGWGSDRFTITAFYTLANLTTGTLDFNAQPGSSGLNPFTANIRNIISLTLINSNSNYYPQIDDIALSTSEVPLPGAVWFLGSAITIFAGFRRKAV